MTKPRRRRYPVGDDADLQLAALLWLLARQRSEKPGAALAQITLDHFELVAGNPQIAGAIRVTCAQLTQQWRRAVRIRPRPAHPLRGMWH